MLLPMPTRYWQKLTPAYVVRFVTDADKNAISKILRERYDVSIGSRLYGIDKTHNR